MSAPVNAFSTDDTIVAIATPPGRGAVGLIRLSGPAAHAIATGLLHGVRTLRPRYATLARIRADGAAPGDQVLATFFPGPDSYTGQDVVELSAHGSPVVLQTILERMVRAGARLARPGEFTLRAHLNGKLDLVQAEAVADLIAATTPLQARVAFDQLQGGLSARIAAIDDRLLDLIAQLEASLDFPDEGYHFVGRNEARSATDAMILAVEDLLREGRRGRIVREGVQVVVTGRPNVGKSLLFNALVGYPRSIVTAAPGTTRDLVSESVDFNGLAVTVVDTAGMREAEDAVEIEGVRRAEDARRAAGGVVLVLDGHERLGGEDRRLLEVTRNQPRVVVVNKCDLPHAFEDVAGVETFVRVSARTGDGIENLRSALEDVLLARPELAGDERQSVSNLRHIELLEKAAGYLRTAQAAMAGGVPEEFVLSDLQAARACFDDVVGQRTSADVLVRIFERFCIGK